MTQTHPNLKYYNSLDVKISTVKLEIDRLDNSKDITARKFLECYRELTPEAQDDLAGVIVLIRVAMKGQRDQPGLGTASCAELLFKLIREGWME